MLLTLSACILGFPALHLTHTTDAVAGDDDLDARLAALRKAKGATPDKQGSKAQRREGTSKPEAVAAGQHAMHSLQFSAEHIRIFNASFVFAELID